MRRRPRFPSALVPALLLTTLLASPISAADAPPVLDGFDAAGSAAERARETQVDSAISPTELRDWMQRLSARPHHVGSAWGLSNAEWLRDLFASWGYEARIESFDVLFPTPLSRSLEMTAPTYYRAKLEEPTLAADGTSGQKKEQLPTYNAYSVDGSVEGEIVYVNYGVPADYEELARHGIDVKGKIALARYGGSWRGIKPKVAAEHGAIGCLIFSDPAGDGYFEGSVYPDGGWRSRDSVQRGSVADMPLYSGDPLTPGVAATKEAHRLPLAETPTLTKIPVLPISYGDAEPLLRALGGPMAPEAWRGALPLPYRLGPGPTKVKLALKFDWTLKQVHDVIAVLPGAELPDEWVVRGNHHDAWVNGAADPISGMVSLLGEAKAIAGLAKQGWRPRRTLVFAAWDGEEPGLIGSTEWVEAHAEELHQKAVAYLNTDSVSRGFLGLSGSHSLERFVNQAAREVDDPELHVSVLERARGKSLADAAPADRPAIRDRHDLRIAALGSGSDYTPFLQYLGLASLSLEFGGQEQYGQYHSIYDSFAHYTRFMDPEFAYVATSSKVGSRIVLRLADADVLPFTLARTAEVVGDYARELHQLTDTMRTASEERNRLLADGALTLAADPKETFVPPPALDAVPYLEFSPLDNAAARFAKATAAFDAARDAAVARGLDAARTAELNAFLRGFERRLTRDEGLPGRPWYKHQLYAPGQYTGYGVKTLPAIREAIELRRWDEADTQIGIVAGVLDSASAACEAMTAKLTAAN